MAQRFSWVQQCTATLGFTWRSHLRSIFTHRNLLGSLTFFFPFEHNLFSTQTYFLAFFFKEKNNIHHSKKSPTAFTNLSRDKTRNKVGLWEPVKRKHTGEKFQEPSASPHPLFSWHESLYMLSLFGANKFVFFLPKSTIALCFLAKGPFNKFVSKGLLNSHTGCQLLLVCLLLATWFPSFALLCIFFMCMSVWHTQDGCHENCNTFL